MKLGVRLINARDVPELETVVVAYEEAGDAEEKGDEKDKSVAMREDEERGGKIGGGNGRGHQGASGRTMDGH